MATRSLNPEALTPTSRALYDFLADGKWHDNPTLIAHGVATCVREERDEALHNGRRVRRRVIAKGKEVPEADLIDSGAKDIVRNRLMIAVRGGRIIRDGDRHKMTRETCAEWAAARPDATIGVLDPTATIPAPKAPKAPVRTETLAPVAPVTRARRNTAADPMYGGITQAEGWESAPLMLKSRVHFRTEHFALPLDEFRADLPAGVTVSVDEGEGLYRVDCPHGDGYTVRDWIRDWCEDHDIQSKGLRAEPVLTRRDVRDLPADFLSDLCLHSVGYAKGVVRKFATTLNFHFDNTDDLDQQLYEWILEAAARYDYETGVPFHAFLATRIKAWVHDLNRSRYSRTLADAELRQQRAHRDFVAEHDREPTEQELADAMGQPLHVFRRNAKTVSTLQGLRNAGPLASHDGEMDIPLADDTLTEDRLMSEEQASLISQLVTRSCTPEASTGRKRKNEGMPNLLGWVTVYETMFRATSKTSLSDSLGTSVRNMNTHYERAMDRMKAQKDVLL